MQIKERFEPTEVIIKENKFIIYPFNAQEAFRLQAVLLQKIGPALGELLGAIDLQDIDIANAKINSNKIGSAIQTLFMNLGEDEYWNLLTRLLKSTECITTGDKPEKLSLTNTENIDKVFRKHTFDIFELIINIIKVNYSDFFVMLEGIGSNIKTFISESGKTSKGK